MFLCMYVFVYVCIYVRKYACIYACVFAYMYIIMYEFFVGIQHAPLHSNITCFTVKYSLYCYIYLSLMYNCLYFL